MNADSIPLVTSGILSLMFFLFLLIKKTDFKAKLFAIFCFGLFIHGISSFLVSYKGLENAALFLNKLGLFGLIIALLFFFHFSLEFTKNSKKRLLQLWYFISFIFGVLCFTDAFVAGLKVVPGGFSGIGGWAYPVFGMFVVLTFGIVTFLFINYLAKTKSEVEKNKTKYLLALLPILVIAGIIDLLRKSQILYLTNILVTEYAIIFFMIGVLYTIMKYKLLDIQIIMHKSALYSIIAFVTLLFFELLKLFLEEYFSGYFFGEHASKVSVLALTFFFEPIKKRTEKLFDRLFVKS
jgi:hypothetical protein